MLAAGAGSATADSPTSSPPTPSPRAYPIKAVCTTGMVADAVRNVGGGHVAVTGLMGEGVDPHLYKVSPGDVRLLHTADLIFYNGLLLEGKMVGIFVKLARTRPVFAVTDGVPQHLLRSPPQFNGHHDPHVWFDVSMWMSCVEEVRDRLSEYDPSHSSDYAASASAYLRELGDLHAYAAERMATIPDQRRVLVTAHDAFGYFGRAYRMEVRGIQGISTESEASVKDINNLVDFLVGREVKAVFVETSVSEKNVRALVEGCRARGHAIRVGGQLFSDAMGAAGSPEGTYLGMVRHNVHVIVEALK